LTWTEKQRPEAQEAVIGVLFVVASSGGILLLANNPHGGEELKDLLVGQILWVTYAQLISLAMLTAVFLTIWFGLSGWLGRIGFYALFAVMVTASVQVVGVYLVFASLIVPALACYRREAANRLPIAYTVGAIGDAAGLA